MTSQKQNNVSPAVMNAEHMQHPAEHDLVSTVKFVHVLTPNEGRVHFHWGLPDANIREALPGQGKVERCSGRGV